MTSASNFAGDSAFGLLLEIAEDIGGAYQLMDNYLEAEGAAKESLDSKIRKDRSIIVPAIGSVESRCNEFLQRPCASRAIQARSNVLSGS